MVRKQPTYARMQFYSSHSREEREDGKRVKYGRRGILKGMLCVQFVPPREGKWVILFSK